MAADRNEAEKNPFFKIDDLRSIQLSIQGKNSTSRMPFDEGVLRLTEVFEDGIWIEAPIRSCSIGHSLVLDIQARKASKKSAEKLESKIHVLGVIAEVDTDAAGAKKGVQHVKVRFKEFSIKDWKALLKFLSEKQFNLNLLMKRTRK